MKSSYKKPVIENILKAAKGGDALHPGKLRWEGHCIFLSWTAQARRSWVASSEYQRENCQPQILYPSERSSKNEGKIKIFSDTQKLKEFITSRPLLVLQGWMSMINTWKSGSTKGLKSTINGNNMSKYKNLFYYLNIF